MKTTTIIVSAVAIILSGCVVQKELIPTGGSRADGTVELSYEFGMFEQPKIDLAQGARAAAQRCIAWGYSSAEPFGGQKTECQQRNGFGECIQGLVTIDYQCIGGAKAP